MDKVLNTIRQFEPSMFLPCFQIRDVHKQQYQQIQQRVPLGLATVSIRNSFYFNWLYKELDVEFPSQNPRRYILIHIIGYLRGHERYCRLLESGCEFGSLWNLFQGQAKENARMLLSPLVHSQGMPSVVLTWAVVMDAEERLMKKIWEHNGLPVPERAYLNLSGSSLGGDGESA